MIIINPQGRLANQMFQLMLAHELKRRIGQETPITGFDMPDWKLVSKEDSSMSESTAHLRGHLFNLDRLAFLLRSGTIQEIIIHGWGMRLEYYQEPAKYQRLFQSDIQPDFVGNDDQLLINVRAEDIASGWHPKYFPMCFNYYEMLITETGLEPVFMGQLGPSSYTLALKKRFPAARFLPVSSPIQDFQTIRKSRHIALSVSSFSWLAAWLSDTARTIHYPVCGLFDPGNRETMLLPIHDTRYRFYRVPFPSVDERKELELADWANHVGGVFDLSDREAKTLVIDSMVSKRRS